MDERPPIPYEIFDNAAKEAINAIKKQGDESMLKLTKALQSEARRNNIINHNISALRELTSVPEAIAATCSKDDQKNEQEEKTFSLIKEAINKSTPENYKENKAQALILINEMLSQIKASRNISQIQLIASAAYSLASIANLPPEVLSKVSEVTNSSISDQKNIEAKAVEAQNAVDEEKKKMKAKATVLLSEAVGIAGKITRGEEINEDDHSKLDELSQNSYAMAKLDEEEKKHKAEHEKLHKKENKTGKDHAALEEIKNKRIDNAVIKAGAKSAEESRDKGHNKSEAVKQCNERMKAARESIMRNIDDEVFTSKTKTKNDQYNKILQNNLDIGESMIKTGIKQKLNTNSSPSEPISPDHSSGTSKKNNDRKI